MTSTAQTQHARVNNQDIAYTVQGAGEPVLLIHGALAGAYRPLVADPALAEGYRTISYDRPGYGGSAAPTGPRAIADQAADARALLRHLGIERAHIVGHSYGGLIALQLALDAPEAVASLTLMEAALPRVLFSVPEFGAAMGQVVAHYQAGDKAAALDTFLQSVCGPAYRADFDRGLGTGGFDEAVAAADTIFQCDLPALQTWAATPEDGARITCPTLTVVGGDSDPVFQQIQQMVPANIAGAEGFVLPNATHLLMVTNPSGMAGALASFLARHPIAVPA